MNNNVRVPVPKCTHEDTLNLVNLAFQTSVMLSLCTDMEQNKDMLLRHNFKSIVERDLQNVGERFSNDFLTNIEKADEKATLNLLTMFYGFNTKIKVTEDGNDYTNAMLLVSYCASIFRVIHSMSYKDNSLTTLKNLCHKCVSTFNRQYPKIADTMYNDQNLLETLVSAVSQLGATIKYGENETNA